MHEAQAFAQLPQRMRLALCTVKAMDESKAVQASGWKAVEACGWKAGEACGWKAVEACGWTGFCGARPGSCDRPLIRVAP